MMLSALILGVLLASFTVALAVEWGLLRLIIRVMGQAGGRSVRLR